MNARDLIGRRIVAVTQARAKTNTRTIWSIDVIVLDDLTTLRFVTHETENGEYAIECLHITAKTEKERPNS